jgi:hypothetical protein
MRTTGSMGRPGTCQKFREWTPFTLRIKEKSEPQQAIARGLLMLAVAEVALKQADRVLGRIGSRVPNWSGHLHRSRGPALLRERGDSSLFHRHFVPGYGRRCQPEHQKDKIDIGASPGHRRHSN